MIHIVSLCALYRLSWSHPHQRTCTIWLTHVTRSLGHRLLSAWVSNERPRGHNSDRILILLVILITIFTGIESIPPGMSNLGVTILIGFWYAMPHEGEVKEVLILDMHKNTLHSNAVPSLLREQPKLIALFPMMRANTHFRWFPAYVEEVQSGFTRGCLEAQCPSKTKRDGLKRNYLLKSTVQLMPGDVDLTTVNPFQGERKIVNGMKQITR